MPSCTNTVMRFVAFVKYGLIVIVWPAPAAFASVVLFQIRIVDMAASPSKNIADLMIETLALLKDRPGGLRCAQIGEHLYRDRRIKGSCPYARIAGKVLARLYEEGHVWKDSTGLWRLV